MVKFLLFILLAYAAYMLFKRSGAKEVGNTTSDRGTESPVELVKDPSCGTFVEKQPITK